MTRSSPTLFVYGMLQDDARVRRLVGRRVAWRAAVLRGYCRTIDPSIGFPVVRRRAGASVRGRLLLGVDAVARAALDAYEGAEYRLARARVRTLDGDPVRTHMYVPVRGARASGAGAPVRGRLAADSGRAPRRSA